MSEAVVRVRSIPSGSGSRSLYINIPKRIAEALGIKPGDYLVIEASGEGIVARKLPIRGEKK